MGIKEYNTAVQGVKQQSIGSEGKLCNDKSVGKGYRWVSWVTCFMSKQAMQSSKRDRKSTSIRKNKPE